MNNGILKIGVTGCSFSSNVYGHPWHYYMGEKLNAKIIDSSSPGAGNEMNFEKVKYILDNHPDLDLFVFQVTEPGRFVIGLDNIVNPSMEHISYTNIHNGVVFNGMYYYTINGHKNDENLTNIVGKKVSIDDFIVNHSFTSDYNQKYKIFHTLLGIQQLCDFYNKKVIFFSWVVDLFKLADEIGYGEVIKSMNIVPGYVEDTVSKNKIKRIKDDGHFDSENSERIYNEFIHEGIKKFI